MASAKSVTVALRSGVTSATLPNNRKMVASKNYAINLDDYAKLSRVVRNTVVTSTINTTNYILPRYDGTHYALDISGATYHNTAALPPKYSGATEKFKVGDVVQGFNGTAFKLVLLSTDATLGNVAATTTKNVAVWLDKTLGTVSVKTSAAGNATADFAGVFIGAVTAGRYGWIQIEGYVDAAAANANVTASDQVLVNPATDGQFVTAIVDVQTITLTAGLATETFKITFNGHESSAAVTLPVGGYANTTAAQVQTALNTVSDFALAANQPVVTGPTGGPFVVTFSNGIYKYTNAGALTLTSKTGAANGSVAHTTTGAPFTSGSGVTKIGRAHV